MKAGSGEQIGEPCVRTDVNRGSLRLPHDPPCLRETPAAAQVGLNDVNLALLDELAEPPNRRLLLARGNPRSHARFFDMRIPRIALGREEVFEPIGIVGLQRSERLDRLKGTAVHAPTGVDHQCHIGPDNLGAAATRATLRLRSCPKSAQPNLIARKPR